MSLGNTLSEFNDSIKQSEELISCANGWVSLPWSNMTLPVGVKPFEKNHEEILIEIAFFQSFLNWEKFLESSFISYLMGDTSPNGLSPKRYFLPPNPDHAERVVAESKDFADWTVAHQVITRAERFFEAGEPFSKVLKGKQAKLDEIKKVRNAVAHVSNHSYKKFSDVVRDRLGNIPPGITVGKFLSTRVPNSKPTISFLNEYMEVFKYLASEIVPS